MTALCLECHSRLCAHIVRPKVARLSQREVQILTLLAGGPSNKEIASATGLSAATVKVYMSHIFPKIGVTSRFEAALWARDHAELLADDSLTQKAS